MPLGYPVAKSLPILSNGLEFNKDILKLLNLARVTIRIIEYLPII